jgi:hypothetical protein
VAPSYSTNPVRYSSGELSLEYDDISAGGFGVPWGHTRSFANRLSENESVGQGFNWQVHQWPCAVADDDGNVTIVGRANGTLWFNNTGATRGHTYGKPGEMRVAVGVT